MTNFDVRHCHKWAQLLAERKVKLRQALSAIEKQDFDTPNKLMSQIFGGVMGKQADPGMAGSLLYHMAMVSKMEAETQILLEELKVQLPNIKAKIDKIYGEFYSDAQELTKDIMDLNYDAKIIAKTSHLSSEEKIALFIKLKENQKQVETQISRKKPKEAQT
jgi:hypothetical protein